MSPKIKNTHFPRENRNSVLDRPENIQGIPGSQHPHLPEQAEHCLSVLQGPQCIQGEKHGKK